MVKNISNLELASLLKEDGYDETCDYGYANEYGLKESILQKHPGLSDCGYQDLLKKYGGDYEEDEVYENRVTLFRHTCHNSIKELFNHIASAPHIYDAKKWIELKYNIYIETHYDFSLKKWSYNIYSSTDEMIEIALKELEKDNDLIYIYNTETEAMEKACVDYLKNKINKK